MPILEHDKAIEEYYQEIKDKYPDIDFKHFRIICRTVSLFIKEKIQSKDMPTVVIKGLGKFRVFAPRIKLALKNLASSCGGYSEEDCKERKRILTERLKTIEDEKERKINKDSTPTQEIEIIE